MPRLENLISFGLSLRPLLMPPLHALIVDDSPLALEINVMLLQRRGYQVCACLTLGEVKRAAARFCPDVVLLDANLPEAPLEEVCTRVRELFGALIPLVLFSGEEPDSLARLCQRLRLDGFISKADDSDTVYREIEAAVNHARDESGSVPVEELRASDVAPCTGGAFDSTRRHAKVSSE